MPSRGSSGLRHLRTFGTDGNNAHLPRRYVTEVCEMCRNGLIAARGTDSLRLGYPQGGAISEFSRLPASRTES